MMDEVDLLRAEIESGKQFKTVLQGFDKKEVTETVTKLMVENAELTEQLEKARSENLNLKKQLRDLQREQAGKPFAEPQPKPADKPEARDKAAEEALAAKAGELAALQGELAALKSELDVKEKELAAREKELAAKESALAARENDLAGSKGGETAIPEGESASKDISSRVMIDTLKSQIARLNEDKKKRSLRIAELEESLAQEQEETAEKMAMLNSINANMITALQEKIFELKDFTDEWKTTFSETEI